MALVSTTSGFYEGLMLSDLEKNILFEVGSVSGVEVSYNRFPQWLIRQKLTDRQNMFVFLSACIKKRALLTCKADYENYKLPVNCMEGGVISAHYFSDSTSYDTLEQVDSGWLDENHSGWRTAASSDPQYCFQGEPYGNIPMLSVYPKPDANGTNYTISPDTGIVTGGSLPGTTNNITGTATGGGTSTLVDSTATFSTDGVVAGMYVRNVTDGSYAYVLTVAETTLTFAAALTGGSDNTFAAGDSYNVLAGEYGVVTSWDDDDTYLFGSEVGEINTITVPAGNILVEYIPYPLTFPATGNDDMYPEIPKLYHMALAMGVVADLLQSFHEKSREFARAAAYEKKFTDAVLLARGKKESRPFKDKPTMIYPKMPRRRR